MTIFLDSTALFARFSDGPEGELVIASLRNDPTWCVSAVAHAECQMLLQRLDLDDDERRRIRGAMASELDMFHVVPLDGACLDRATEIGRVQPVRTVDAIHLAAADRLPRPLTFATFDANQIGPAMDLGFEILSSRAPD